MRWPVLSGRANHNIGERAFIAGCGLVVAAGAAGSVVLGDPANGAAIAALGLFLVALGGSVLVQVPGNRVGRAYLVLAVLLVLAQLVNGAAEPRLAADSQHWLRWLVAWSSLDWLAAFAVLTYICFVFPDGAPPGRTWRRVRIAVLTAFPLSAVAHVLSTTAYDRPLDHVRSPWAAVEVLARVLAPVSAVSLVVCGIGMLAAVGSLVARARRSVGLERLQLRWLSAGLALAPALLMACLAAALFGAPEAVVPVGFVVLVAAVPLSTVVAIRRHGLWRINHLVSTTVTWSLATACVVATYAVVVVAVGGATGGGSPWRVAAATLAAAAVARPSLRILQQQVDRVFDRPRAAAVAAIDDFTAALQHDEVLPEEVGAVMARALREPGLRVLYRQGDTWVDVDGRTVAGEPDQAATTVARDGNPLALLLHEHEPQRPDVVQDVVRRCRLALEAVALRSDLRARVVEVEASRRRILSAGDAERRRLERDLHDGAQQRLVALGLGLRLEQDGLVDLDDARLALDHAVEGIGRSLQELRDLAQGLHARAVAEQGLMAALRSLALRSPVPVIVDGVLPRLGIDIESTAWFVACEAITNASKHADASRICVRVARDGRWLRLAIEDDGCGGADVSEGTGLLGLIDRVSVVGGTLSVNSPVGSGTTIAVELPCES